MKILKKHTWKFVVLFLLLGFLLLLLGFSMGAKSGIYVDSSGIHITEDTEYRSTNLALDPFSSISINVKYLDISFIPSNQFGIDVCYYDDESAIYWEMDNGTLRIEDKNQDEVKFLISNFSFLTRGFKKGYIKIYLPTSFVLDDVSIQTNSSDLQIDYLSSHRLNIENTYGNFNIENSKITNMKLMFDSGNVKAISIVSDTIDLFNQYGNVAFENVTTNDFFVTTGSDDIFLKNCIASNTEMKSNYGSIQGQKVSFEKTQIMADSGNIIFDGTFSGDTSLYSQYGDIKLISDKDETYYSCHFSTNYGKIRLNNDRLKDTTFYIMNRDGSLLKLIAQNGDIDVNFK